MRVRFYLGSPLCFPAGKTIEPLILDSIMGYVWALEHGLSKTPAEDITKNLVFPTLPIEHTGRCYAASAMFLPKEKNIKPILKLECLVKGTNWIDGMVHQGCAKMRYDVSGTWTRGVQEKYWILAVPYVDFYARPTHKDEFIRFLKIVKEIGYLGAKRNVGYGKILQVSIAEDAPDWAYSKDGQPTRPLPVTLFDHLAGATTGMANYFSPYWFAANRTMCYLPPVNQYMPGLSLPSDSMVASLQDKRLDFERIAAASRAKKERETDEKLAAKEKKKRSTSHAKRKSSSPTRRGIA